MTAVLAYATLKTKYLSKQVFIRNISISGFLNLRHFSIQKIALFMNLSVIFYLKNLEKIQNHTIISNLQSNHILKYKKHFKL